MKGVLTAAGSRNWMIDKRYHSWAARAQIIRQDTSIKLSLNHLTSEKREEPAAIHRRCLRLKI